jgi:hypothetical protein
MHDPAETESAPILLPPDGRVAHTRRRSCGARFWIPAWQAAALTICQIAFGVIPSRHTLPSRFTRRKIAPPLAPDTLVQSSTARFAHAGTGTVRICFPLPIKSARTQWSSRSWKSSFFNPTSSARRSPHPINNARIARSRLPRAAARRAAVVVL